MRPIRGNPSPRLAFVAPLLVGVLCGCTLDSGRLPPPTEAQARAHLAEVVRVVQGRDLTGLCELGSGTCASELEEADPARVPDAPPIVVGTAIIQPTQRADGAWNAGGFLLRLCGVDGTGEPYRSEMLVFAPEQGRLISINTLYWLGAHIADGPTAPQPPIDLAGCR